MEEEEEYFIQFENWDDLDEAFELLPDFDMEVLSGCALGFDSEDEMKKAEIILDDLF